jgi:glycosyltransferase involved in cell wall biosynthesis
VPSAELHVYYHVDKFVKMADDVGSTPNEIVWLARTLRDLIRRPIPGVTIHNAVSRAVLASAQAQTRVMAYPFDPIAFTEGFSTAILEALAAGCRAVVRPDDALHEVYNDTVAWVPARVCDEKFEGEFARTVADALVSPQWPYDDKAKRLVAEHTWDRAAAELERAIRIPVRGREAA